MLLWRASLTFPSVAAKVRHLLLAGGEMAEG